LADALAKGRDVSFHDCLLVVGRSKRLTKLLVYLREQLSDPAGVLHWYAPHGFFLLHLTDVVV